MKVVCWSPVPRVGTTSSLLLLSMIAALEENKKTLVLQTNISKQSIESYYLNQNSIHSKTMNPLDYMDIGIDALSRKAKATILSEDYIKNCVTTIYPGRLEALPSTKKQNEAQYEEEILGVIEPILTQLDSMYSFLLIDTLYGRSSVQPTILKHSDLLLLCTDQSNDSLEKSIHFYDSLEEKKKQSCFFLITNYKQDSKYSDKNIRRKYHLKPWQIGTIPFNTEFMDAFNENRVLPFYFDNYKAEKEDSNYTLIAQARQTLNKILSEH